MLQVNKRAHKHEDEDIFSHHVVWIPAQQVKNADPHEKYIRQFLAHKMHSINDPWRAPSITELDVQQRKHIYI